MLLTVSVLMVSLAGPPRAHSASPSFIGNIVATGGGSAGQGTIVLAFWVNPNIATGPKGETILSGTLVDQLLNIVQETAVPTIQEFLTAIPSPNCVTFKLVTAMGEFTITTCGGQTSGPSTISFQTQPGLFFQGTGPGNIVPETSLVGGVVFGGNTVGSGTAGNGKENVAQALAVDSTGRVHTAGAFAGPIGYQYSDATGYVVRTITTQAGTWAITQVCGRGSCQSTVPMVSTITTTLSQFNCLNPPCQILGGCKPACEVMVSDLDITMFPPQSNVPLYSGNGSGLFSPLFPQQEV